MLKAVESIPGFLRIFNQMSRQPVISRICNSRGDEATASRGFSSWTRDNPSSQIACRCGILLFSLVVTASGAARDVPSGPSNGIAHLSPEGFSASSEGLPDLAMDAWYATVRVEGRGVSWRPGKCPRQRLRRGSGIVVKLTNNRRLAVIATNSHIISCAFSGICELRVGFGESSSPCAPKWSNAVRVVSRNPRKDLAILEVEVPSGAEVRTARFASPACCEAGKESVFSIGWPDLKVRKKWGVTPPPNYRSQTRRHSDGLLLFWSKNFQLRSEAGEVLDRLQVIFHNADVLPGSSGGPLTNRDGEVLGVNTMIEGIDEPSATHEFCAGLDTRNPGKCVHIAISSHEVIKELERFYPSRLTLAECALRPQ